MYLFVITCSAKHLGLCIITTLLISVYLFKKSPKIDNNEDEYEYIVYEVDKGELIRRKSPIDWKFNTPKYYNESSLHKWSEHIQTTEEKSVPGMGENGMAFTRINESDPRVQESLKKNGYNLLATEMMSLHRSIPDYRCDECKSLTYPSKLPTASVIFIFHNEPWSLLLRSVWSVIDRSPCELIEEIILVDDDSDLKVLKRPLEDYIELLPVPVKLIRTKKREGLIRARLFGAKEAKGSVLIFLDSHIEVTKGWLPPLLTSIADDRSVVATPYINRIDDHDFSYKLFPYSTTGFIGLNWFLNFTWSPIPERETKRTNGDRTLPLRIATLIGCAIAVDREFFYEIGAFDADMEIWGGENLEMALRVWQCGGSLLLIPCSHIGHLFRIAAYSFNGDRNVIKHRNNLRITEVWLDEFKELYYAIHPESREISPGDLTERRNLRERLQCKSFRWYLDNISPESRMRHEFIAFGEIRNLADNECLDTNISTAGMKLVPYDCHKMGGNQFFAFTQHGLIITRYEGACVGISKDDSKNRTPIVVDCSDTDKLQRWRYNTEEKTIQHIESGLCMQVAYYDEKIELAKCDGSNPSFQWLLEHSKSFS